VVTKAGQRFIFDCGTGARVLGNHLLASGVKPITANLMLSHSHWDHIQGFPFFSPLFIPGNVFTVCAPQGARGTLPEVLAGQMEYTYFPVELGQLGANISYLELTEGSQEIGGVVITAQLLNHPATTLGYRMQVDGVTFLYLCDHEPYWEPLWDSGAEPGKMDSILHDGDKRHAAFMQDADVVVHEAQYTTEEYPAKRNWGHSTYNYVAGVAAAAGVKRLFLTHHDPMHNDDFLDGIELKTRAAAAALGSRVEISCAREGFAEKFEGDSVRAGPTVATPRPEIGIASSLLILIVDDDEDLRILAGSMLTRSGHRILNAASGEEGLGMIASRQPDLVLLDLNMPGMNGFEMLRQLRATEAGRSVPVVVLTAHGDENNARGSFELGAVDFLPKPFTAPQLDARVRLSYAHATRPSG
jgi:CheY-like chemotaxis protein